LGPEDVDVLQRARYQFRDARFAGVLWFLIGCLVVVIAGLDLLVDIVPHDLYKAFYRKPFVCVEDDNCAVPSVETNVVVRVR